MEIGLGLVDVGDPIRVNGQKFRRASDRLEPV